MNDDARRTQVVPVGTATVWMRPVGFAQYAGQFLAAGSAVREVPDESKFSPVPFYLFCRALELILKSFLLVSDFPRDDLKKKPYGHDLLRLLKEARSRGLEDVVELPETFEADLTDANDYYNGKAFEYFDFRKWAHGYEGLPPLSRLQESTEHLIAVLKPYCISEA